MYTVELEPRGTLRGFEHQRWRGEGSTVRVFGNTLSVLLVCCGICALMGACAGADDPLPLQRYQLMVAPTAVATPSLSKSSFISWRVGLCCACVRIRA